MQLSALDTSEIEAQLQAIKDEYQDRLEMHKANPDVEPDPMRLPRVNLDTLM